MDEPFQEESKYVSIRQNTNTSFLEANEGEHNLVRDEVYKHDTARTFNEEEKGSENQQFNNYDFEANSVTPTHVQKNSIAKERDSQNDTALRFEATSRLAKLEKSRPNPLYAFGGDDNSEKMKRKNDFDLSPAFEQTEIVKTPVNRNNRELLGKVHSGKYMTYFGSFPEITKSDEAAKLAVDEAKSENNEGSEDSQNDENKLIEHFDFIGPRNNDNDANQDKKFKAMKLRRKAKKGKGMKIQSKLKLFSRKQFEHS
jgi:hypothetical protein